MRTIPKYWYEIATILLTAACGYLAGRIHQSGIDMEFYAEQADLGEIDEELWKILNGDGE